METVDLGISLKSLVDFQDLSLATIYAIIGVDRLENQWRNR